MATRSVRSPSEIEWLELTTPGVEVVRCFISDLLLLRTLSFMLLILPLKTLKINPLFNKDSKLNLRH